MQLDNFSRIKKSSPKGYFVKKRSTIRATMSKKTTVSLFNTHKIIKYLNENFCEALNISSLGKIFGYNETYLCQKFKECTGLTIINYINILRLEKAQELLKTTDKPISEVAFLSGFNDLTYFSHCFKNKFNISPTGFRKNSKST